MIFNKLSSLKNMKPLCKDCKYFLPYTRKCAKFFDTNLVTGSEIYEYASSVRTDKNKCGNEGSFFEKNKLKIITVPLHFLNEFGVIMIPPFVTLVSFIIASR